MDAPVLVTGNFSLTVKRVLRSLRGHDLWVLVASSGGINVWCGACGGDFNHNRVIDAIKTSMLPEKVRHREVILPALSAPGMDRKRIKEETGFSARFGPVYARDLPLFLSQDMTKTEAMKRVRFDLRHKLDMILSMNLPVYLLLAFVLLVLCPQHLPCATLLFWFAVFFLYMFIHRIPGRTGWAQGLVSGGLVVLFWSALDGVTMGQPLRNWGWFLATLGIFWLAAFDLAGIVSARQSDPEALAMKLGLKKLGKIFRDKRLGAITLARDRCIGCRACAELCPLDVFGALDSEKRITYRDRSLCFQCGACVMQCPEDALDLKI